MADLCEICEREGALELVSSGCAPVTYAACPACRARRAESLEVAATWYLLEGGGETAEMYLARMTVWEDGAYVGGDRVRAYFEQNRERLLAELNAPYELVDLPLEAGKEGE